MTSELTRERVVALIAEHSYDSALVDALEHLLAALDSESECLPLDYLQGHKDGLEWAAQLAKANHPETGDWLYDDPIELAKAIRKGPDMPPAQSVDSEPVAWIVHARTGDQLTTDCSYVANAEGILGLHSTPLYRNAQPAPTARMVVIPTIWKHYTAVQTAIIYEKAMTDAGIKWRSIDD